MIYLPHPTFKFDGLYNGDSHGVIGYLKVPTDPNWPYVVKEMTHYKIDLDKMFSKFEKARSSYWQSKKRVSHIPDPTFCFVREDGHELAIRFIRNEKIEVVGYWTLNLDLLIAPHPGFRSTELPEQFVQFTNWLEKECPA